MSLFIFSGIRPGLSGVGNLMISLEHEAILFSEVEVYFRFWKNGGINLMASLQRLRLYQAWREVSHRIKFYFLSRLALFSKRIIWDDRVVLVSPQTLGFRWCKNFITRRKKPTWLYIMDAGFFCIRSVNHIPGENGACLRCLGGHWSSHKKYNCKPFPGKHKDSKAFVSFLTFLMKMASTQKVRFLVQNNIHQDLEQDDMVYHYLYSFEGEYYEPHQNQDFYH